MSVAKRGRKKTIVIPKIDEVLGVPIEPIEPVEPVEEEPTEVEEEAVDISTLMLDDFDDYTEVKPDKKRRNAVVKKLVKKLVKKDTLTMAVASTEESVEDDTILHIRSSNVFNNRNTRIVDSNKRNRGPITKLSTVY